MSDPTVLNFNRLFLKLNESRSGAEQRQQLWHHERPLQAAMGARVAMKVELWSSDGGGEQQWRRKRWRMSEEMVGGGDPYLPHDPLHTWPGSGPYPWRLAGIRQYPWGAVNNRELLYWTLELSGNLKWIPVNTRLVPYMDWMPIWLHPSISGFVAKPIGSSVINRCSPPNIDEASLCSWLYYSSITNWFICN